MVRWESKGESLSSDGDVVGGACRPDGFRLLNFRKGDRMFSFSDCTFTAGVDCERGEGVVGREKREFEGTRARSYRK